jgi:signal transduction histidine kinase/amino acid transporter/ActR/RegA family two-component response regulator
MHLLMRLFSLVPADTPKARVHPRTIGWLGTSALAMGGSNQSLFLIGALVLSQGTGAIPLLIVGLLLSWAALPGWTELIMMWPNRVGGIAATCAEAFRPYSPVLANLTGVCYWWGWVPTCGLTAILSAAALHEWYMPWMPIKVLAVAIVLLFTVVNLCGVKWATRVAIPMAFGSAALAFLSGFVPVLTNHVSWQHAASFHLDVPFHGVFGIATSAMAGLYLIGFAAPAFEAASCHVGETTNPTRNVPRAMFVSAGIASLYFVVLPVVWLGVIGKTGLSGELMGTLGPTFAPLLGAGAKAAAVWFMVLNMFHGTLQPLAGASRTLSQLSEDGLLPRLLSRYNRYDVPVVATCLTAAMSIAFLMTGDPTWVIAAANFTYLIGIGLPSIAVWLLRRNHPEMERPYRAPRGFIVLGAAAAGAWLLATVLGFQQFGLPTVLAGLGLAYAGSALYAYRVWSDRRRSGAPRGGRSLHLKLTGAMLLVMVLDGAGYLLAVSHVHADPALVTLLEDIFVAVALLTISVGLVLPGMIAHATMQVSTAAERLAKGTLAELTRAMQALAAGDLDGAHAHAEVVPVVVTSRDEVGRMAESFNDMQEEVARAAVALDGARDGLRRAESKLELNLRRQSAVADLGRRALAGLTLSELYDEAVISVADGMPVAAVAVIEHHPGGDNVVHSLRGTKPASSATFTKPIDGDVHFAIWRDDNVLREDEVEFLRLVAIVVTNTVGLRRSEEQLRQAQKLEAVGTLAGGIAHDFNNMLQAISGHTHLLLDALKPGDVNRPDVEQIGQAADRAANLTRQLLAFSRRQVLQPKVIDLAETVGGIEPMLKRLLGEDIEIVTTSDPARGRVRADPGQIEQVIVNLAVNARHAMPHGGTLNIDVRNRVDGRGVLLTVSDSGHGMDRHTKEQIFEPFFTTKQIGEGTGLGLSTVYGIVQQSGGTISVRSAPGEGAAFAILLPLAEESDEPVEQTVEPLVPELVGGDVRILLVEDDESVRKLIGTLLTRQGYDVSVAASPNEAIALCEKTAEPFELLISDVVMPSMNGPQLAAALLVSQPNLRVLYVSGYPSDAIVQRGIFQGTSAFLQKPFTPVQLAAKVREVMDEVGIAPVAA